MPGRVDGRPIVPQDFGPRRVEAVPDRNAVGDECVFVKSGRATLETVFGSLPVESGDLVVVPRTVVHRWIAEDIDTQAATISNLLNIKDLQDPTKVQQLAQRFTAMWDASGNNTSNSASSSIATLLSPSTTTTTGFSTNLLMSIAQLPAGGF